MSERTWPENTWPTPEQYAGWFAHQPPEDQVRHAEVILEAMSRSGTCLLRNHEALEDEVWHLRRAVFRYRTAWRSARRRVHPHTFLRRELVVAENARAIKHELETPWRGHDEDGACCEAAQEGTA